MQTLVAAIAVLMIFIILGVFARNILRRSWDFFSWRNMFLLGFLHFYCLSAYFTASGETLPEFLQLNTGGWAELISMMVLFFGTFMVCASIAVRRRSWTKVIPKLELPVTAPALVTCTVVLSVLGLVFSIPFFNYLGVIAAQIRGQLGACAVALATYYLVSRRFNPMSWLLFAGALGAGAVSSTVGLPGRRLLLGVMLAVPWMWYFAVWRYRHPVTNMARVGVFVVIGALGLIMYTPMRAGMERKTEVEATIAKRAEQFAEILTNPKIDPTVIKYLLYADTVPSTMWVLQNYPNNYGFMPFHGAYWFAVNPIPRQVLPGKPEALGAMMQKQMNVPYNVGPGIIAHGWSEAWFFGVIYYAVFFGLLVGVVDRAVAERCWNPYFLAVFGANLGNVVGLPRGDTPLFMIQIVGGLVSSGLVLYLFKPLSPVWAAFPPLLPPTERDLAVTEAGEPLQAEAEEQAAEVQEV